MPKNVIVSFEKFVHGSRGVQTAVLRCVQFVLNSFEFRTDGRVVLARYFTGRGGSASEERRIIVRSACEKEKAQGLGRRSPCELGYERSNTSELGSLSRSRDTRVSSWPNTFFFSLSTELCDTRACCARWALLNKFKLHMLALTTHNEYIRRARPTNCFYPILTLSCLALAYH